MPTAGGRRSLIRVCVAVELEAGPLADEDTDWFGEEGGGAGEGLSSPHFLSSRRLQAGLGLGLVARGSGPAVVSSGVVQDDKPARADRLGGAGGGGDATAAAGGW